MNLTFLALGFAFLALAVTFFAQAKRATDGKTERGHRLAATLFAVAAIAFFVAASLGFLTGRGG
jgi:hypothetical protein